MEFEASEGYLVLADISGYTEFLTRSELEHAHAIVRELTSLIRRELVPPLRFVKLEGDAVFCYANRSSFHDGERFVELVEACYFAFSNRLDDMMRATTCRCRACASIGSLDLKFLAHYGTFVVDVDDGREDLAGTDVILVHRLLKNTISDLGTDSGYAYFTEACLRRLPPGLDLPVHAETYDGLGTTTGAVYDLWPILALMREARSQSLTAEDADLEIVAEFPTVPALVWQYYVDPTERQRWVCLDFSAEPDVETPNREGRLGVGATSHCNHGPGTWFREFLDWRPLASITCRTVGVGPGPPERRSVIETFDFRAVAGGTQVTTRVRIIDRETEATDAFQQLTPILEARWRESHEALRRVIEKDASLLEQ